MEPVSFTASVLTLLAAAGGSCKFLYNFVLDVSDAPSEIYSQNSKLSSLHRTFLGLIQIYESPELPPELQLDSDLHKNLLRFIDAIDAFKTKIQRRGRRLDRNRRHHAWERLIWLSSDRELHKFYSSLDNWDIIFRNAVSGTTMNLLMAVRRDTAEIRARPPQKICTDTALEIQPSRYAYLKGKDDSIDDVRLMRAGANNEVPQLSYSTIQSPLTDKRLSKFLSTVFEPYSLLPHYWSSLERALLRIDLRLGCIVARSWCKKRQALYTEVLSNREGYCMSSSIRLSRVIPGKLSVVVYAIYRSFNPFQVSLKWHIKASRVLEFDGIAYSSCVKGDWASLQRLFVHGKVGLSDSTVFGDTLLHIAAQSNNLDLVSTLLGQKADVNATNDFGETALHIAVERDYYDVARLLLNDGADLMQQDHMGRTPLHHFFNRTTQRILEYHQDDIDSTADDFRGMTIAHYVAWSKSATVADFDRCSGGQSSIEKIDQDGRSAIHLALYRGNLALVDYFLKLPNRPEFLPDWHGRTVLHYAVESKRTNTIDMLHSNGFDLHVRDLDGRTPLHYAASKGKLEAVKRLLDLGATADLTALDLHGMTPLQLARVHKADAVTQHLQLLYPTGTANQEHPKNSPVNFPSTATKRGHHGLYYPFTLLLFISILIGFINIQPQYFKAWCI